MHSIESLDIVKTQAAQHKAHTGIDLSYSQYTSLLLSVAQQHDKQFMEPSKPRYSKRKVYEHALDYENDYEHGDTENGEHIHDIDSAISSLSINQAVTKYNPPFPCLTHSQWHRLTDEAKKTWDLLSNDMKAIILEPRNSRNFPAKWSPRSK